MSNPKIIAIAVVAVLVVAGAAVAVIVINNNNDSKEDSSPHTYTDIFGQEFTVNGKIKKSVIQSGPPLTFASYLGPDVMNTIVATGNDVKHAGGQNTYSAAYDLTGKATITQSSFLAEIEKIAALEPDIVIVAGGNALSDSVKEFCAKLKDMGIAACAMKSVSEVNDETFQKQLRWLAEVFDVKDRAEQLIAQSTAKVKELQTMLAKVDSSDVKHVFAGGINWGGADGFLKSTSAYTPFIYLGNKVINVYSAITTTATSTLNWEQLYDYEDNVHDIDMIFMDSGSGYAGVKAQYQEAPSKFTTLSAWGTKEVYNVLPWCSRGMMPDNSIIIAYQIAYMLYPEIFDSSFDMTKFTKDMWNLFMGFDCGTNVYNMEMSYYNDNGLTKLLDVCPLVN